MDLPSEVGVFQIQDTRSWAHLSESVEPRDFAPHIEIIPGVFLPSIEKANVNKSLFQLRCGRKPLLGEIGAALAHKRVAEVFLNSKSKFALVFESDAVIVDENKFQRQIMQFVEMCPYRRPAIGLLFHQVKVDPDPELNSEDLLSQIQWLEFKFTPSYAVAYIMNRNAAEAIINSQKIIWSVADWPLCSHTCQFYGVKEIQIEHLSEAIPDSSQISSESRGIRSYVRKLAWLFGLEIMRNLGQGISVFHIHWCLVLLPRLLKKSAFREIVRIS